MINSTSRSTPPAFLDSSPLLLLADLNPAADILGYLDDFDNSSFFDLGAGYDLDPALWSIKAELPSKCNAMTPSTTDSTAALKPYFEALQDDDAPVFCDLFRDLDDFELGLETIAVAEALPLPASVVLTFSTTKCECADGRASLAMADSCLGASPAPTPMVSPATTSVAESTEQKRVAVTDSIASTRKTSSQRQKEEIIRLRDSAAHLEQQLAQLKAKLREAAPAESSKTTDSSAPTLSLLWEGLAKRQREARQQAEEKNAELRRELHITVRAAKSLERSLHKRQRLQHDI